MSKKKWLYCCQLQHAKALTFENFSTTKKQVKKDALENPQFPGKEKIMEVILLLFPF
jgi:hypothetical protein